jgi:hypothetical protein
MMADFDFSLPLNIEAILGGSDDDVSSLLDSQDNLGQRYLGMISQDDAGIVGITEQDTSIESCFRSSVRNHTDHSPQWRPPIYRERMVGVCNMIEHRFGSALTLSMIGQIADWMLFKRNSDEPLSVRVRMKKLDDITRKEFVMCYRKMEKLYDKEMEKEKQKSQHFKKYFEDLIESWALVDMTQNVLVSEAAGCMISVWDLLWFAQTRIRLVCIIERLLFHHFLDQVSGAARFWEACLQNRGQVSDVENNALEEYRNALQERGDEEYEPSCCAKNELCTDNLNHHFFLQLLSVHKRRREVCRSKSRSKRKWEEMNPEGGIAGKMKPDPPLVPEPDDKESDSTDTELLEHEKHDNNSDDIVMENPTFRETLESFLDPVLIARLKNQLGDEDKMKWNRLFEEENTAFQSKFGGESDEDHDDEDILVANATSKETLRSFLDPALIARLKNQMRHKDRIEWNRLFQLENAAYERKKGAMV